MIAEGLNDVIADFTRAAEHVQLGAMELVEETAEKIRATAEQIAPDGSRDHEGQDLSDSIHTTIMGLAAEIGPSARHGRFVEKGTYKDAPQPYMGPSSDQHEPGFQKSMEELGGNI